MLLVGFIWILVVVLVPGGTYLGVFCGGLCWVLFISVRWPDGRSARVCPGWGLVFAVGFVCLGGVGGFGGCGGAELLWVCRFGMVLLCDGLRLVVLQVV